MKVLFLDIDGVLNNFDTFRNRKQMDIPRNTEELYASMLDADLIKRFYRIVKEVNPKIVLSSTWRLSYSKEWVSQALSEKAGAPIEIYDVTPRLNNKQRGEEIHRWLMAYSKICPEKVTHFAVLDDDSDMDAVWNNFVKTRFETGITEKAVDAVIELLNKET